MLAACAPTQGQHGIAFVEGEHLRFFVAKLLCDQRGQQGGLARAGRPQNHGMPQIARVQTQTKRSRAIGLGVQQRRAGRRIERARIAVRPSPNRRERQQMRQVQGVDQRTAHVRVRVARHRAQISLNRIHRFDARAEAGVLDDFLDFAGDFVQRRAVVMRKQNDARVVAEAHRA